MSDKDSVTVSKMRINALRLDFQPPENLTDEGVSRYVEMLRAGQPLPPVSVRFDGVNYFLQDGFHRVEAAKREGIEEIEVEIAPGTLADMESEFREYLKALRENLSLTARSVTRQ